MHSDPSEVIPHGCRWSVAHSERSRTLRFSAFRRHPMQFLNRIPAPVVILAALVSAACAVCGDAQGQVLPGGAPGIRPQAKPESPESRPESRPEPRTGEELVRVAVGVVGEAKPGATVRVAATFTIHPGWHIYWANPGESGMPTQIDLDLPSGCTAATGAPGEMHVDFPVPQVFAKGETTFGYEKSVTLSVPVTLPAEIPAAGLPVTVRSRWLVCKEACLLGQNEAKVDLAKPVAADAPLARAAADALARTPKPLPPEWKCAIAEVTAESAVLTIEAPGASELKFLPYETPGARLASGFVADAKGASLRAEFELSRESTLGKPLEVSGIVVVGKNGSAYSFRLPVPAAR
jgi:DsbC/DsbD-like thiol-disulfide interchange protein